MRSLKTYRLLGLLAVTSFTTLQGLAQTEQLREVQRQYGLKPNSALLSRVTVTPDEVLKRFRDAGMSPTEHQLTKEEITIVSKAFDALPQLNQRVLKQHLKSISFLDNMPNTALTSPVTREEGVNLYHITFRSGILHQTISEWVTEKEKTCFTGGDSTVSVSIQAGLLNALTYVMLHESTHVVDGSLHLISTDAVSGKAQQNVFTAKFSKGVWKNINSHDCSVKDSILLQSRFRPGGRILLTTEASRVYAALAQTPFVSLYSTASWHEDLAELLTIYHLTHILKQPFRVAVMQNGKEVYSFEPMHNPVIKKRVGLLQRFYGIS
jgi:hypothetical protein